MRVVVLTNPAAGAKSDATHELRHALTQAGADVADVRQVHGAELTKAAKEAATGGGVDAVVAAGGDGTVSAVASGLVGTPTPLGVLPTGTLNHFARDLGLPMQLSDAARVIAAGRIAAVDVAEVNDRPFLNNSSIGLYPRIVDNRDRQRQRLGRGKWLAMLLATMAVFRRFPTVRVRLGVGKQSILRTTPFVFVGNNPYDIALTSLGQRKRLDTGELCVYFTNRTGRFGLFRLALRALLGRLEQARDFDALGATELWIESRRPSLRTAIDGEVTRLATPLHYRMRPRALKVLVPQSVPAPPLVSTP